jgi:predicted HTH domain antitoxin
MNETAIEFRFALPLGDLPAAHRSNAERKAQEAFVLSLLKQGDISAGRAAELLDVNRWQLSELMSAHGISPFDEQMTREELEREVTDALSDFRQ